MPKTDAVGVPHERAAQILQLKQQNKRIANALGLLSAAWAVTLYVGVNYISNDEDSSLSLKLAKTLSSVFINFCIVHILGKGVLQVGLNHCRIKELRSQISLKDGIECAAVTTGSVTASFIYADLAPTMRSPIFDNPIGYTLYLAANTPFHYYGTKTFLHHFKRKSLAMLADWFIASGLFRNYFIRQKLDARIREHLNQKLDDALLAHDLAQQSTEPPELPKLESATAVSNVANVLRSIDTNHYINKPRQHTFTQKAASALLFSCIITAIAPFFFDSYSSDTLGFAKFVSTVVANIGLAAMMTKDYTHVIANTLTYHNPPQLVRRNNDGRHIERRLVAFGIVASTSTVTAFTVFTTLSLFNNHMAHIFKTPSSKLAAVLAIWIGTLCFNIYAVNSLCFKGASAYYLSNDRLHQFTQQTDQVKQKFNCELSTSPQHVHQHLSEHLSPTEQTYLSCNRDLRSSRSANVIQTNIAEARCHTKRALLRSALPLIAAIGIDVCIKQLSETAMSPPVQFAILLAPFLLCAAAGRAWLHTDEPTPSTPPATDLAEPLLAMEEGTQGNTDHTAMPHRHRFEQLLASCFNIGKGVLFGAMAHGLVQLLNRHIKHGLDENTVVAIDTALTVGVSCLNNS